MTTRISRKVVSFVTPEIADDPKNPPTPENPTPLMPALAQAVSVALAIMKTAKTNSWSSTPPVQDLPPDPDLDASQQTLGPHVQTAAGISILLTDEQVTLLADHAAFFYLVTPESPALTVAVCPTCEGWTLVDRTTPTSCKTKIGCAGKPVKASPARKSTEPAAATVSRDVPVLPSSPEPTDAAPTHGAPDFDTEFGRADDHEVTTASDFDFDDGDM